jgi:integrase/recombinase XerD
LANVTVQQRLVAVRLFYDYLIEEGLRETNPVGRGTLHARERVRWPPGQGLGAQVHQAAMDPH